jgi:hypothetical protein
MQKIFSHAYLFKSYTHFLKTASNSKLGGLSLIKVGVTSERVGGA